MDSVGLVVPKDKEPEFLMILENILQTKIVFCDTKASETAGTKISDTIIAGVYISSHYSHHCTVVG